MKRKDFIRIINEEVGEFDFLNNEKYQQEQEILKLLENPQFQKQFIIDSITKMRDKISFDDFFARIYNDPDFQDQFHNDINLEVNAEIGYIYDPSKDPIKMTLTFNGTNIHYETDSEESSGDQHTPSYSDTSYKTIAWDEIDVNLYSIEGDEIEFVALKKAPNNIKELFIRSYIEDVIKEETDINDVNQEIPNYTSF